MTLAEQAERMAERLRYEDDHGCIACRMAFGQAAALLRQCAEALRKEGV